MCPAVNFSYRPGLKTNPFSNVQLAGSWDAAGHPAADWTSIAMRPGIDPDGCPCFDAQVHFDDAGVGIVFNWGVRLDGPAGADVWGIAREVDGENATARVLAFTLQAGAQDAVYYLTQCHRLGAVLLDTADEARSVRFSAWAPNARAVELVLADPAHGYVANDGQGTLRIFAMVRGADGVWSVGAADQPALADARALTGAPYMFRITKDDGSIAYRTDMYSRGQIGQGTVDPNGQPYNGPPEALDGPPSCSVVCDARHVRIDATTSIETSLFWRDEFDDNHPLPADIQDLVIYELHVGALGYGKVSPGTLDDAIGLLDHLTSLGVNTVELMPIAEFESTASWGYGTAQFLAIDQAAGGADRLRVFVKACHRRGIAVILDVCYNHFDATAERAEWQYDSNDPAKNIYFWYEGASGDYPDPAGGYIDNQSSGWAPRYDQEMVRQLFISSAAWFVQSCHIDGFRLDQTSCIHQYPVIHATGQPAPRAAAFGTKFLRQWTRTMRLLKPELYLTAEDYSDWPAMIQPSLNGDGLGFDATWYGDFQHNLVEFNGGGYGELVKEAGFGDDRPLAMDSLAGVLRTSANAKIVYGQSHDDCGNRPGSARTIVLAVNGAPLIGQTRKWAEARQRFAAGMALLSAGTPMFFMGEESGAQKPYRYDNFLANREDLLGDAAGIGAALFGYYRDLIRMSIGTAAVRSRNIDVACADDANRVIAFHRWTNGGWTDGGWTDGGEVLIAGSLANTAFANGYWLSSGRLGDAGWTEIFNSDAQVYGGWNVGNAGRRLQAQGGALNVVIPACGFVVLRRC
jgi:1,4-alpha-glucan branching enzyme